MAHHFSIKTNFSPPREISMISIVQDEPLYRNKVFLQQKYLSEGLSAGQIAREISSARSTVVSNLIENGVDLSKPLYSSRKGQLAYGEKLLKGRLVPHLREQKHIQQMVEMRTAGASFGQIAIWLSKEKIPTKNKVTNWDRPTVFKIIKRATIQLNAASRKIQEPNLVL